MGVSSGFSGLQEGSLRIATIAGGYNRPDGFCLCLVTGYALSRLQLDPQLLISHQEISHQLL